MAAPQDTFDWIFEQDPFQLLEELVRAADCQPARPGDFGPYQILGDAPLGSGAMGDVWLAEEPKAGRRVAIKMLRGIADPTQWAGREISRLGTLEHQNIARLYNHGVDEHGAPWLAMEYVEGERLDNYWAAKLAAGTATLQDRLSLFRRLCEAVRYAHGRRIIHGDLKPSNVVVTAAGEPKLLDFGLAEQFQLSQPAASCAGFTPAYAAPEQFSGAPMSFQVDVYSLGVILYECLTGTLPFDASRFTEAQIASLKVTGEPQPPSRMARRGEGNSGPALAVSGAEWRDLDALCLKAIARDAGARYQSVDELIHEIDRFQHHDPLHARRPYPFGYSLSKFVRRNQRAVLAASVAAVTIFSLIAVFTYRLALERDKAQAEVARTRLIRGFMEDLVGAGDSQAGPARGLTMLEVLDRGAAQAASLASDPETQIELYQSLAATYQYLGLAAKSETLLKRAQEKALTLPPSSSHLAMTLVRLALLRASQEKWPEAEGLARQALRYAEAKNGPHDEIVTLHAKAALGKILVSDGAFDEGISILTPLSRIKPSIKPAGQERAAILAEVLTSLAVAYHYKQDLDRALSFNQQALELDIKAHGSEHPRVAEDLANIASAKMTRGDGTDASDLYKRAVDIEEAWYGPDHPDTLEVKSFLAQTMMVQGKDAEAEQLLQKILAIQERDEDTSKSEIVAFNHDLLGKIASRRGDLKTAEREIGLGLEIYRKQVGASDPRSLAETCILADIFIKEGQNARAETILQPAVGTLEKQPTAGNIQLGMGEVLLGRALLRQARYREAEPHLKSGNAIFAANPGRYTKRLEDGCADLAAVYTSLGKEGAAAASGPCAAIASHAAAGK